MALRHPMRQRPGQPASRQDEGGRSSERTVRYDSKSAGRTTGMNAGDSREQQEG